MDDSSGFDEKDIGSVTNPKRNSSTPIGKENDWNYGNCMSSTERDNNCSKPVSSSAVKRPVIVSAAETTKLLTTDPVTPRSLIFSPTKMVSKHKNPLQPMDDDFFATPSVKPAPTTGRVIFSSSQHKLRQRPQTKSDYQKMLFTTPQAPPPCNRVAAAPSNTSDYDSFNSVKKTSFLSVLSPIDEEKISIDDFLAICANDDGTMLANKLIEINRREFVLKKKIGSGGSCSVFSVKCKMNGSDRALKVVNLRTDANSVASYLNEAKLLDRLQGNPCVIKLYEQ